MVNNPSVGHLGEMISFKMKDYFAGNTILVKKLLRPGEALALTCNQTHLAIFLLICSRLILALRVGHFERMGSDVRRIAIVVK